MKDLAGTRTAFFLIHGLYDFNVRTSNVGAVWGALPQGAPKKLWLLDGDHVDPDTPDAETATAGGHVLPFAFRQAYRDGTHRWWAQFLKGLPAGALETPTVEVQGDDGRWAGSRQWPVPTSDLVLSLRPDGTPRRGSRPRAPSRTPTTTPSSDSAASFVTAPFAKATRLSGQVVLDLAYTLTGPDTSLAVRIDLLPPDAAADAPVGQTVLDGPLTAPFTVGYGHARAAYREDLQPRGLSTPTTPVPVVPGELTRTTFGSLPLDVLLRPGTRLRFVVTDTAGGSLAAATGGEVALQLGKGLSAVRLPVAR